MFAPPDHLPHPVHDIHAAGQHPPGVVQVTLQVRAGHPALEVSLKTPTSQTVSIPHDDDHLGQGRGALARGPALVGDVGGRGGEGEEAEAAHHHRQVGPGHGLAPQHGPAAWSPPQYGSRTSFYLTGQIDPRPSARRLRSQEE